MKKTILIFTLMLLMTTCSTDDKKQGEQIAVSDSSSSKKSEIASNTEDVIDEPALQKDEMVEVKYKFKKGDKYQYRMTSYSSQDQSVVTDTTMSSSANQTVKYSFNLNVVEVQPDGKATISLKVNSIEVEGNYNGTNVYYNSLNDMTDEEKFEFADYEIISNSQFKVGVEPSGKVADIFDVDNILTKMMFIKKVEKQLSENEKNQAKRDLSESALRPLTQQLFRLMPADKVQQYDEWSHNYSSQLAVFNIVNTTLYSLDNFYSKNNFLKANISAKRNVKVEGDKSFTEQGVDYAFDEPNITGKGQVVFNVDKGIMERSETTTTVKMTMTIKAKDASNVMQTAKRSDNSVNTNIVELL